MPNEKIYVGRARYRDTQYGEMCKIWLYPEGIEAINANVDSNGSINLNMSEMRQPDGAGFTHVLVVDDWKPGQSSTRRHGPQRRDDGGFGAYGNSEHRYGPEDRDPPAGPTAETVSPEPFPEKEIERGGEAPAEDYSDIDDEIPF